MSQGMRQRVNDALPAADAGAGFTSKSSDDMVNKIAHPVGPPKHSKIKQYLLVTGLLCFFLSTSLVIFLTQLVGLPLYLVHKGFYYAWMAMTKELFGLVVNCVTQWFTSTTIRVSGDASVRGQLKLTKDGRLETDFPERLILVSNHQIYTDWLYLWWAAYTSRMHGHICIILKESLKYIPVIGEGMMLWSFIFLARNWAKDKARLHSSLAKIKDQVSGHWSGSQKLAPIWLLIFPEGTNTSVNGRNASKRWAEKSGQPDMVHCLLPKSTGLHYCLQELKGTVEWVYDCTIAYEGVPRGQYGQDIYPLWSTFFEGRAPKSVNMYWRRFRVDDIPIDDIKTFEAWLRMRWDEKDRLLEHFMQTGMFPSDDGADMIANAKVWTKDTYLGPGGHGYIETSVKNRSPFEFILIYVPLAVVSTIAYLLYRTLKGFV